MPKEPGSEAGSYLRLIDFVYHSSLGLRVLKKTKTATCRWAKAMHPILPREEPHALRSEEFGSFNPPWRQPRGKPKVNLPQMLPLRGSSCMEVYSRDYRFAPELPPVRWRRGATPGAGNQGANDWFLQPTPVQMPPLRGGICGRLTRDLPSNRLQGGLRRVGQS